jgi:hypothetical protein
MRQRGAARSFHKSNPFQEYGIVTRVNNRKNHFKTCQSAGELEDKAVEALAQIDGKRCGAELDRRKPLWNVGVSFFGEHCKVLCKKL